jgi:hypothetical protein
MIFSYFVPAKNPFIMKNPFFFRIFFTAAILLILFNATAQNDSIMRINRKYKYEVGVDMSELLQKTPGTALILKIKNNSGRFVELKSAKNYRLQLAVNGSLHKKETVPHDTSIIKYKSKATQSFYLQAMFGVERVNFYGKFNFYYGVDIGPYYNYINSGYTAYGYVNGSSISWAAGQPYEQESRKGGIALIPFAGAKYRFSEHFSASIESGFNLAYFFSKTTVHNLPFVGYNTLDLTLAEETATGIDFSMKYLRFLTLNYHL